MMNKNDEEETRLRLSLSCNKAYGTNTNDRSSDSPAEKGTNRTGWSHPLRPQPHLRLHPHHHNKPATDLPDENLSGVQIRATTTRKNHGDPSPTRSQSAAPALSPFNKTQNTFYKRTQNTIYKILSYKQTKNGIIT
ncbi:hypothetical protein AVEN_247782-1 [Araneus ventricosus]|uniref:Uncharacterized protein n=1 Tax=Araneus ventricosus TaxID=182803 RepID=A0A4Y2PUD7_ARAVE|nr:hypothetical protein AVEN_247782-1 [Araneus ventricosus]